jgi:branched-chain amino acid transport system substrate-binding protein
VSQIDRRHALKLFAGLGATGLLAACGRGSESEDGAQLVSTEQVKIGLIAPQTGGYSAIGEDIIRGFRLFLELNDGLLGNHPVQLLTPDEGDTADSGKAALEGLLKQGVLALTGIASSAVMLGIRDIVEQARVPLVGSNASPAGLQGVVYIWRTSYVNDEPGRALGPYVAAQIKPTEKVGIIAPDSPGYPAGRDSVKGFREEFGIGVNDPRLSAPIWTEFDTAPVRGSLTPKIGQLLAGNPAAVYCFFAGQAAIEFIRAMWAAGYRGPIYSPGFLTEGIQLSDLDEQEVSKVFTALNYSPDLDNNANRTFASAYRKLYSATPTTYAVASYDAAQVLDTAIRLAGDHPTPQSVNLALSRVGQVASPRGDWQFNQPRTPQQRWYLRRVQRDGPVLANVLVDELATLG